MWTSAVQNSDELRPIYIMVSIGPIHAVIVEAVEKNA